MDEHKKLLNFKRLEKLSKVLEKNRFETFLSEDSKSAANHVLSLIGRNSASGATGAVSYTNGQNKKIGLGGSQTVRSLGLVDALKNAGNEIITHTPEMDKQTRIETWLRAQTADFYLASPQAITLNGELILIDAYGNRAAAAIYGPKKVILIAGHNKIVKDLNEGLWRIRNIAAVANNIRLGRKNPCVISGKCEDCDIESRICNVVSILYRKPVYTDYLIVLVNEELGY
ncbi:MAG: lactate utilization protein [Elusimicrobia bacterium]|nr:lactate utilization protein [Elusimicrobiota bacterium]